MGGKAILFLMLLAGALVAVLWFTDEKPTVEQTAESQVLDGRAFAAASKIRWQFRDKVPIEIGRSERGELVLEEPVRDLLSRAHLDNIDGAWTSARMHSTPLEADEQGLEEAGLDEPVLEMHLEYDDGTRIDVLVGKPGPLGITRFLLRDGKIWEGGTEALTSCLHVGSDELRERSVFRNAYGQVRELRVEQQLASGTREALHLKLVSGEWQLLSPVTGRADPVAAQRFVTGVSNLRVSNFHHSEMRLPDGEPDLVLHVVGSHGDESVRLWEQDGQVYGVMPERNETPFACDNREYGQIFGNLAQELRARILVPMGESTFEELVELVIDPGQGRGKRIRLVRRSQADEWRLVEPIEYDVRDTPVSEAAHALTLLVANEFVDGGEDGVRPRASDPKYGLGAGRWTVSTRRNTEKEMHTLWFGDDVPGAETPSVYVCRSDEPDNIALVRKVPFEVLQRPFTAYCARKVVKTTGIERLDLEHRDGRRRTFLIGDDGWILQTGDDGSGEARPAVGDFANDYLCDLFGKEVVDMEDGFGEADWILHLSRRNGDGLGIVRVWDRGEDAALLVQSRKDEKVGHELSTLVSRELRALWK